MNNSEIKALYVHIPFCTHLCDYCDFPKLLYLPVFANPYLEALKKDLDRLKIDHPLKTIYVGGGTPTSLSDDLFLKLLELLKPYSLGVEEYTIEANPESLSLDKLKLMKKYGVNRLSIGVESTDDEILKKINRHHTFLDVIKAVNSAKEVGIDNINADLILGVDGNNKEQISLDIDRLISLDINHISCYSLTVHENTLFYLRGVKELDDDTSREFYDLVNERLVNHGFIHYEISNWAKNGYFSQHNLTYWRNEKYYAVGLGASGYINNIRYSLTKSINQYLLDQKIEEREIVSLKEEKEYQIILNLRTIEGIDLKLFKEKYKQDLYLSKKDIIDDYILNGYLELKKDRLYPTYSGMMILDKIIIDLI